PRLSTARARPEPIMDGTGARSDVSTLSLHDALPILDDELRVRVLGAHLGDILDRQHIVRVAIPFPDDHFLVRMLSHVMAEVLVRDRKSTRLNSSHVNMTYAVFFLQHKVIAPARTDAH